MEIIEEVEKSCLYLEKKGKKKEAETLRQEIANILIRAKNSKFNLTSQQKKGLSFFSKQKNLSVAPFDKGQGFVVIKTNKLVEKAEKEFKNVKLDTPDTTTTQERKLQTNLREYLKNEKIDTATYKNIYPSGTVTPTANPAIKAHKP